VCLTTKLWIEAVELDGAEQRLNDRRALTSAFQSSKQTVLLPQGNPTDAVFNEIVVNRHIAAFGVARQRSPAFQTVIDGFGRWAIGGWGRRRV
jgi:hypothetical protein